MSSSGRANRKKRGKREDRIGRAVGPRARFWGAVAALPAFLLTDGLLPRALILTLFTVLAVLAGKKIRWGYFGILILSVTFFHILAPFGRVLLEIGPITITEGALRSGLARGFGLVGMVFLSVAAVRPELELPGRLGGLLGRTFYHFEAVVDGRAKLRRGDFFASLDELLLERFNPGEPDFGQSKRTETLHSPPAGASGFQGAGWAASAGMIPWLLYVLDILNVI